MGNSNTKVGSLQFRVQKKMVLSTLDTYYLTSQKSFLFSLIHDYYVSCRRKFYKFIEFWLSSIISIFTLYHLDNLNDS